MTPTSTSASKVAPPRPSAAAPPTPGPARGARPPRLRHSFGWTLAGNVVYAACQWGILVVLAKLSTPEAVGAFALAYALSAPVFLLAGLSLRASQATDAARGFRFADYLGVRVAGMAVAFAFTGAIVALSSYDAATTLVVLTVAAAKAIEGLSDVHYGALQQHERMRPIAVSLVLRGVLSVASVAAVLRAGGSLVAAVAALALGWAAVLLVHDLPAAAPILRAQGERGRPRLDRRAAARLVATCLPLGAVMMLVSLQVNVPRYVIERRLGAAELGVFAALASLITVGNVVVSALGQAVTPRLATYFHERRIGAFRRLLMLLVLAGAALGTAGVAVSLAAGEPILRLLFGARYAGRADVLVVLMGAGLVLYVSSFLGYGLTAARRFGIQLPIFAATTLAGAGACLWLVPRLGLTGAALGWGASMVLNVIAIGLVLELALRVRAIGAAR